MSSEHLERDNNASFHIIATSLQKVAEQLEDLCLIISSSLNGGITLDLPLASFPTPSPTSSPSSGTKPATTTAMSAEDASPVKTSTTSTPSLTTFAKTVAMSATTPSETRPTTPPTVMEALQFLASEPVLGTLWVEQDENWQSQLSTFADGDDDVTHLRPINDGWTLAELLEAVLEELWEPTLPSE